MVYQEIDLQSPDALDGEGMRNYILWDHSITTPTEAAAWTARMRRAAADLTYVMAFQPELGVFCEVPHGRR